LNRVTSDVAMANEPLPLPGIAAEPPLDNVQGAHDLHGAHEAHDARDAEYEAICAEIAATERGHWFLSEHVKRSGAADTDRLVGSLARAEAAMRGDAAAESPGALADDLAKLAAAIGQVGAVIAASAPSAADGLAASERIQDVAFALREREIDPALCDELESALFELGEAFARHDAAVERTQSAAALLLGVEANINALIAFVAETAPAEPASAHAEPTASVAGAPDEPFAIGPVFSDSVSGRSAATEPLELPPAEKELAARSGTVTPSMWETIAAPDVEAMVNDLGASRDSALEDAQVSEEPAKDLRASAETVGESLSVESVVDDALPPTFGEATVVSEPLAEAGSLPDEAPSGAGTIEQSSEQSTNQPSVPGLDAAEDEVGPALQFRAEPADLPAEVPANDENTGISEPAETGIIAPAEDGVRPSAPNAPELTWSADDDIESLLEAEPGDPLPTATQPVGAQEDLDGLFEPLPPELDVQQAAANAVQPEPRQQMFSPELPPAFSAPELRPAAFAASAMQIGAQPPAPPSVPVAPAPAAPASPRPARTIRRRRAGAKRGRADRAVQLSLRHSVTIVEQKPPAPAQAAAPHRLVLSC
jgi:hypothetical protein